ncbi:MAG: protein kinase [Deltaproteobacteria bacterium]|nr:protein kinase [Deltaproteobacteria bacterium]
MPEPGELIGPFRLISQLGKGAMGEVWRARDERLDRYVALKVLPPEAAEDIERRARMLREARAAAAIQHTNVVTLFDIVSQDNNDILVMELVEGRTLSEVLRRDGSPGVAMALAWIESIAAALAAAHERGILHRDIKAANIMVSTEGIKVLDFGLAKLKGSDPFQSVTRSVAKAPPASALDGTMPGDVSLDATQRDGIVQSPSLAVASYRTHVGQLLGTPLYMAPEQVDGQLPDERSEVFSVGVLAFEILTGKPPYAATSLDELFREITQNQTPELVDIPAPVVDIVERALAKDPAARYPTMKALRDAVAQTRRRLFAPSGRRGIFGAAIGGTLLLAAAAAALVVWWFTRAPATRPGDKEVARALEEYNVFYNDKALSSLRGALAVAPDHPLANAYMVLFGGVDADRNAALATARRIRDQVGDRSKDRALLEAAIAFVDRGPKAARAALVDVGAKSDRELAFWAAELDYRAGNFTAANAEYKSLLDDPAPEFRGRIYDHYSSVLLYLDEPAEALRIGTLYRDAFRGEADAVGVYATTLAAAGKFDLAIQAAEEAVRLSEGEDTLAGLAKVVALSGDHARARELYQRSLERAGAARRPLRRAALALLQWIDGDARAKDTVAPCLPGGSDATTSTRGVCLFVAGVVDPRRGEEAAKLLDALAAEASDPRPAYGSPASLARLVRARLAFFGGACLVDPARPDVAPLHPSDVSEEAFTQDVDFYGAYHVPFFASWALCERAALLASHGQRLAAKALLERAIARGAHRTWLANAMKSM